MKASSKIILKIIITVLLILIIIYYYFYNKENFALQNDDKEPELKFKDYEEIPIGDNIVYNSVEDLINENPIILTDNNVIVNLVNNIDSGLGSQLTLIAQNMYYLKEKNEKIICLPHFSKNLTNFKYHNKNLINSFFMYFKRTSDVENLKNYKIYFLNCNLLHGYPFFNGRIPTMDFETNRLYIEYFSKNYQMIRNKTIVDSIEKINKPLIGIHGRNYAQKRIGGLHDYASVSIEDRFISVKNKIDKEYNNKYSIYLATDTNSYIDIAKKVFGDVYYFENITRIDNDVDIIHSLDDKYSGYKLGSDILNECLTLSMCDHIFLTGSNITNIVPMINPKIKMEEY